MTTSTKRPSGCLAVLLRLFQGHAEREPISLDVEALPYRIRDDFLSPAELSFYHLLTSVVTPHAIVLTKVGLSDIFFVARPHVNRSFANRINRKHVDFLLCNPQTLQPIVGIELDDGSHQRPDRVQRDAFVNQVFESANLKLLHIAVKRAYTRDEVASQVLPLLTSMLTNMAESPPATPSLPSPISRSSPSQPICPKCGISMVLRTATRGNHQGRQFYGCVNYPRCREMAPA